MNQVCFQKCIDFKIQMEVHIRMGPVAAYPYPGYLKFWNTEIPVHAKQARRLD